MDEIPDEVMRLFGKRARASGKDDADDITDEIIYGGDMDIRERVEQSKPFRRIARELVSAGRSKAEAREAIWQYMINAGADKLADLYMQMKSDDDFDITEFL